MRVSRQVVRLAALLALACRRAPDVYPSDVVANFMASCTTRSEERVCRCAIDALQQRFTLEEFRGFEGRMRAGELPQESMDAVAGCRR
jgi:hypothetical protein